MAEHPLPDLLIFGDHGMFGTEEPARIAAELPGSVLRTIPGAGHDVHLDAPRAWVRALAELTDS